MPTCARIVGGPGSGKTTRLMDIIDKVISKLGIDPMQIGFVSFTRSARQVAAERAAKRFSARAEDLQKLGYFRTLHSVAYRQLGTAPGELLVGNSADNDWIKNALNDPKARVAKTSEEKILNAVEKMGNVDDDYLFMPSCGGSSAYALALWDAARNRQLPLATVHAGASKTDDRIPKLRSCHAVVSLYENQKKLDGRLDFCDLLMLFAGKRFTGNHDDPFADEEPHGETPNLPVWIHDECQDTSLLCSLVFARLIRNSQWVYLAGDANQSIYEFAGANGEIFANWPVEKEDFLPVSHRCDKNILDLAKQVIQDSRLEAFHPENQGGEIKKVDDMAETLRNLKPGDDVLILTRTNDYARDAARILDEVGIPWKPTKGGGTWTAPAKAAGVAAILALLGGGAVDGEGVHRIMQLFNVATPDGTKLFEHGAKKFYEDKENRAAAHKLEPITLDTLADCGCTRIFKEALINGKYADMMADRSSQRMAAAAQKHGIENVCNPRIRLGTCHSAKGMEADHVVLLNQVPYPSVLAMQSNEGLAAERRVWYTSVTRARHELTICKGEGNSFEEL